MLMSMLLLRPQMGPLKRKHHTVHSCSPGPSWSRTVRQTRANKLYKIANAIEQNLKLFAEAESRDQGLLFC